MSKRVNNKRGKRGRTKYNTQWCKERAAWVWMRKAKGIGKPRESLHTS